MVPAPAIDPTVSLEETLYEAPLETFTAVLSDKYPVTSNVPEVTLVDPVALFVPDKVNTPEPDFVKWPAPEIQPEKVVEALSPPAVNVYPVPILIVPEPVIDPTEFDAETL